MGLAFESIKGWILVKAYPQPSQQYQETVCCAALTEDGRLLRLYPIRYRLLKSDQKFNRFDLIQCRISKAENDPRPESYKVDESSLIILNRASSNANSKAALWLNYVSLGLEWLKEQQATNRKSLGIIKLDINNLNFYYKPISEAKEEELLYHQGMIQQQSRMFEETLDPLAPLEFIFYYRFKLDGKSHNMQIHDWEVQTTYYQYKKRYASKEEALAKMTQFYNKDIKTMNPHFIMGTQFKRPKQFMIIGILRTTAALNQGQLF
ncbi:MAG: hypothetical protein WAQ53_09480 [Thiofilum sp.]|uniref:hypothetical protein n=1 Tax=Thiofilum sp. TaxID=2212733 RepID=UPI0025F0A519|nr:hypothetical protein [Thiofilum sp.]MBK8453088.1 hypothetical protein [Thiofilum sp.]